MFWRAVSEAPFSSPLSATGISDVRIRRLGIGDEFAEHATQSELRRKYGIDARGIAEAVQEMVWPEFGTEESESRNEKEFPSSKNQVG